MPESVPSSLIIDAFKEIFQSERRGVKRQDPLGWIISVPDTHQKSVLAALDKERSLRVLTCSTEDDANAVAAGLYMTGEPVVVIDFLKPGIEEFASLLPPFVGRALTQWAEKNGKLEAYSVGMHLKTSGVFGFLLMRSLAWLKPWRPNSYRFVEEQQLIERWLARVRAGAWEELVADLLATHYDPAYLRATSQNYLHYDDGMRISIERLDESGIRSAAAGLIRSAV